MGEISPTPPPPKKTPTNKRWGLQDLPFAPVLGPNLTPPPRPQAGRGCHRVQGDQPWGWSHSARCGAEPGITLGGAGPREERDPGRSGTPSRSGVPPSKPGASSRARLDTTWGRIQPQP